MSWGIGADEHAVDGTEGQGRGGSGGGEVEYKYAEQVPISLQPITRLAPYLCLKVIFESKPALVSTHATLHLSR